MRAVIQRVSRASVTIDGSQTAAIGRGLLVLVGVELGDTPADAEWLANNFEDIVNGDAAPLVDETITSGNML